MLVGIALLIMSLVDMYQRGSSKKGEPTVCSVFATGPSPVFLRLLGEIATSVDEVPRFDRTATLGQTRPIRREYCGDDGRRPLLPLPPLPCRANISSADGRLRTDARSHHREEVPA